MPSRDPERVAAVDYGERSRRFNETTGVYGYMTARGPLGGNHHPDRCVCQGNPNPQPVDLRRGACGPNGDTTPHKHYPHPPYSCARCVECVAYEPHDEAAKNALRRQAREIVEASCG